MNALLPAAAACADAGLVAALIGDERADGWAAEARRLYAVCGVWLTLDPLPEERWIASPDQAAVAAE